MSALRGKLKSLFRLLRPERVIFVIKQFLGGRSKASLRFLLIGALNNVFNPGGGIEHKNLIWGDDWTTLIILDACRFDYFSKCYRKYLDGELKKAHSPGSGTAQWLSKTLDGFYPDIQVFSSNPNLNSKGISIFGYDPAAHFPAENIIDIWDLGWDTDLRTVHPREVCKAVLDYWDPNKRHIIWFMQPHGPWIGEPSISLPKPERENEGCDEVVVPLLRSGELTVSDFRNMYQKNLELVLQYVKKLIDDLPRDERIVITSDHGELLGEYGSFLHYYGLSAPELREVPYLVVER